MSMMKKLTLMLAALLFLAPTLAWGEEALMLTAQETTALMAVEDEAWTGFEAEVAGAVAGALGRGLVLGVDADPETVLAFGVEDAIMGLAPRVTEDAPTIATQPYAWDRTALIVRGDNESIADFAALAGRRVTYIPDTPEAALAATLGVAAVSAGTLEEAIDLVAAGRVDAGLVGQMAFLAYLTEHPIADARIVTVSDEARPRCFWLREGDPLLQELDAVIEVLHADGTLSDLSYDAFDEDLTIKP